MILENASSLDSDESIFGGLPIVLLRPKVVLLLVDDGIMGVVGCLQVSVRYIEL